MKNKFVNILSILLLTLFVSVAYAEGEKPETSFKNVKDVAETTFTVPTVVEIPMNDDEVERADFLVYNITTKSYEPHYFHKDTTVTETGFTVDTKDGSLLFDNDTRTYTEFLVPFDQKASEVTLRIVGEKPITASGIRFQLDNHVAYPTSIEITAVQADGQSKRILNGANLFGSTIPFPKTTASEFDVRLTYSQILRITEIDFIEHDKSTKINHGVRFLAQPGSLYQVYFNPDRYVRADVGESPNLSSNVGVKYTSYVEGKENPLYVEADVDGDKITDRKDNCVTVANPDQLDVDRSGRGDACEDFDRDGVLNGVDSCPNNPNRAQSDEDGDGVGDECDAEESRLTEKYGWLPWAGMAVAAIVMFSLFYVTLTSNKRKSDGGGDISGTTN